MKRYALLFLTLALMMPPVFVQAQRQIWDKLYVGADVGIQADQSLNTNASIYSSAFYPLGDINSFGLGNNRSLRIGYNVSRKIFIESGFGVYNIKQTFALMSPVISTEYRHVYLRESWAYIPVRIGVNIPVSKKMSFATLIGCNVLVDRNKPKSRYIAGTEIPLEGKRGFAGSPPNPGYATIMGGGL